MGRSPDFPGIEQGSLAAAVRADNRLLLMLEHFEILLPLREKTLNEACRDAGINPELVAAVARLYIGRRLKIGTGITSADLPAIIRYLKRNHSFYLDEIFPEIRQLIGQLAASNRSEEMPLVQKFFEDYYREVEEHLNYENEIAFPYIGRVFENTTGKSQPLNTEYSVNEYRDHHDDIEQKLDDLISLLIKYLPGQNDQKIRRDLFNKLNELDYDLRVHSMIEDQILIPLVESLEKKSRS